MELFSSEFLWGLSAIILIDLVLAGDNAIVIGMAARNLPADQQKKPFSGAPSAPSPSGHPPPWPSFGCCKSPL
jgi:hypothetical protein